MSVTKIHLDVNSQSSVEISLGQTEPKTVGIPENKIINPGETIEIPKVSDEGCAKMFIWSLRGNDTTSNLLWCGIIPVGNINPIKIRLVRIDEGSSVNIAKVLLDDGEVPQCPEVNTLSSDEHQTRVIENFKGENDRRVSSYASYAWWIIFFLTVLLGVYLVKYAK